MPGKTSTRKPRVDSAQEKHRIMAAADSVIEPPAHMELDERDMLFFQSVVLEFARADWTQHALELAALMARAMADMDRDQLLLREEGVVVTNERGTPVINPRKSSVQMNAGIIKSYRASLSLGVDTSNTKSDKARKAAQARNIEANARAGDDDLIAKPTH